MALYTRHEPDLRRFIRSLIPTATDTADFLQHTALVIWRKFDQYDPATPFMKWACVISRFEALAYRRKIARDRLVFREDILDLIGREGEEELELRSQEHAALEQCLKKLSEKQRHFLLHAYTPGVKTKDLAAAAGSTSAAFYMRLKRLRHQLQSCIEKKLTPS